MTRDSLLIPAAIVIAAGFIAAAIYFSGSGSPVEPTGINTDTETPTDGEPSVAPVTEDDHIRGNPNAPIVLIEYSDFDCPFCKQFHDTMNQIIEEYGPSGQVAWVYRQFPLQQLHPNAPKISEASECVAELGGDQAFWEFADLIFEERPTNDLTDMSRLPEFAETAGVDVNAFNECLESGRYAEEIAADVQAAIEAGGRGTPHTVVTVGDQSGVINGAQPYSTVKQIIDNLLAQIQGGTLETETN